MDSITKKLPAELRSGDKPTLHALSYALRHPEMWPKEFRWNFNECSQCAMGLAFALWTRLGEDTCDWSGPDYVSEAAKLLAMPYDEAAQIFHSNKWTKTEKQRLWGLLSPEVTIAPYENITPGMVADEIDRYLARAE